MNRSSHRISRLALLVVLVALTTSASAQTSNWTGAANPNSNWSSPDNWLNNTIPTASSTVSFDGNSTQNLATNNDIAGLTLNSIVIGSVSGGNPVSIGGNTLILGSGGIDMSVANQPLNIALAAGQSLTLGESQTWKLGSGGAGSNQTLTLGSPITGPATATLTYGITNNGAGTSTSGTVRLLAPNTYLGNTVVGGPNTTYEIASDSPFGLGSVNINSFNTAPRFRTVNGPRTLANAMTWHSGFMITADSTSNLTLNGPIVFTGDVSGQVNRTLNVTAPVVVTVNGTVTMGDPSITPTVNGRAFILQSGVAGGSIVVNGLMQDPTSPTNTNVGTLTKTGVGPATINSIANTYSGPTNLQNGLLEVSLLANQGTPSSLGTGANTPTITLGNAATTGTLRYIGSADVSTNRALSLGGTTGGGIVDSSGTGSVSFTADFPAGGAGSKTFTLTGSNTKTNTIGGIIRDNSATNKTSLVKSGSGAWNLAAANTYTGATTVSGGTLLLSGSIANSASVTVTGGTLQLRADQSVKSLDVQRSNTGNQFLDLNNHSLKIVAADLVAAQNALTTQIATSGTDGIYDSTSTASNTGVGYNVVSNYVLVKKTLLGDANLDNAVDFLDLATLAQNYNTTTSANPDWWARGDFNYDGSVDFLDLAAMAQNYNTSLPSAPIPGASADFNHDLAAAFAGVPEPSSTPLIALAAAIGFARRTARNRKAGAPRACFTLHSS
jgi:autotransporter-associated beta strand protein